MHIYVPMQRQQKSKRTWEEISMAGASRLLVSCRALQSAGSQRPGRGEKGKRVKVAVALEGSVVVVPEKQKKSLIEDQVAEAANKLFVAVSPSAASTKKRWELHAEMLIERGVIGCQSFTLIAVAGSLIGSILCFIEGCFLVLESFLQYSRTMYHKMDQGGLVELLIQALDMFLVGTALLTFGMGLYVMFTGSDARSVDESSCFGTFNLKRLSDEMGMESITEAKSKVGHAVVLILQAGVLDRFKSVPLTTSLDLACFAGAVFVSSASVFLLSKLSDRRNQN